MNVGNDAINRIRITNEQIRAAFLEDGLSVGDASANEWVPMQEAVYALLSDAAEQAGLYLDEDDVDALYARADAIVARIDMDGSI
jgi:uncharacterized protein YgfB (UPF0149 family)